MRGRRRCRGLQGLSIVAALLVAVACDKGQAGAATPGSGSAGGGSEAGSGSAGVVSGSDGGSGGSDAQGAAPRCDPALSSEMIGFFGMRMLIKLPEGVELVEQNPFFARSATGGQASSCGASVTFAALGFFRSSAPLGESRRTVMRMRGLAPGALSFEGESNQTNALSATFNAAAGEKGEPAAKGLVLLRRDREWVYWLILEAKPDDFGRLEGVFQASVASLMVQPRG